MILVMSVPLSAVILGKIYSNYLTFSIKFVASL